MRLTRLALAATLALAPAALLAQQTTVPIAPSSGGVVTHPAPTLPPSQATGRTIANRKVDQQNRIANGVSSGQLTARETSHLEGQEAAINKEEHAMRQQDNGHLTSVDKRTLDKQQNAESRRIYRDKHNARVRAPR